MKVVRNLCIILFLAAAAAYPDGKEHDSDWLSARNPNAKMKALGGAGVALNNNNSPLYSNPGNMTYDPYGRLGLFYGNLIDGSHFAYLDYIYPFSAWGSIGAGIETRINDSSDYVYVYSFGLAGEIFRNFSVGVSGKALKKTLSDEGAQDYGLDSGIHYEPLKWLDIGFKVENIVTPELTYEESGVTEVMTRDAQAGLCIFRAGYFSFLADVYMLDLNKEYSDEISFRGAYGIEIYPDPAFPIRGGVRDDSWSLGVGILSRNMNFDYAIVSETDASVHYFQCVYKFGISPSRKEKELMEKEKEVERETIYFEGVLYLRMGEVSAAKGKVEEYKSRYGEDKKIKVLEEDIEKWLNKIRQEKIGRVNEFKKEILTDYYHGKLADAMTKLENLKLIAPNFEEVVYLEYLLNAGLFLEKGDYDGAEQELIKALQINPDSREVKGMYDRLREVMEINSR